MHVLAKFLRLPCTRRQCTSCMRMAADRLADTHTLHRTTAVECSEGLHAASWRRHLPQRNGRVHTPVSHFLAVWLCCCYCCCCCCYRRRIAQPLVRAFGAFKHARGTASLTYHEGLASAISMHSCTNCERLRTAVKCDLSCADILFYVMGGVTAGFMVARMSLALLPSTTRAVVLHGAVTYTCCLECCLPCMLLAGILGWLSLQ
jgi:hypothetical protein